MSEKIIPNYLTVETGVFFRLLKENTRLKELNRKALNLLDDFLGMVELSPPAQDRFDEILTLLAKAEEGGD